MDTKTDITKNIIAVGLFFAILYPMACYFRGVRPSFIIAFTGLALKFTSGGLVSGSPVRYAVACAFTVIGVSFLSVLVPITAIPLSLLVLTLLGIFILLDYKTLPKYEWYSRPVIIFIIFICLFRPGAWGVNELFYGAVHQALRLPDWAGRVMGLIDEVLKFCGLKGCKE